MNLLKRFKENASDTTKALVLAGMLVLGGTALVTAWTAAIAPQHDHAAYVSTVLSSAVGSLAGFTLAVTGGFLGGGGLGRQSGLQVVNPVRRRKSLL